MKKYSLILLAICITFISLSQDVITKKNGDEINAKILEVGLEVVKYKKFESLNGPTYLISKNDIFMIKYEDGSKDLFIKKEQNKKPEANHFRKGTHLGFHFTPGAGQILKDGYSANFGLNLGIDLNFYFNDYIGIKTGVSYLYLPINIKGVGIDQYGQRNNARVYGNISSIGIPFKLLITTGDKVGFYMESGLNLYMPLQSKVSNSTIKDFHESLVIAGESVFGLNIKPSKSMSINLGPYFHYSFTNYYDNKGSSNLPSKGLMIGFQIGLLFNLSK